MKVYYIDRKTGEKKLETVAGLKYLKWGYDTKLGKSLLEILFKRKLPSIIYGKLQDRPSSTKKIQKFVEALSINMEEALEENLDKYSSFNDFFIRELKPDARYISEKKEDLISPADGRVLAYENIDINKVIQVKGMTYKLSDLFRDNKLAEAFDSGVCIVVRLSPADYHRYHFPDSGQVKKHRHIDGSLYSVNPLALKKVISLYCENKRELTVFDSDNFGEITMLEVGATCVGTIKQTYNPKNRVKKGSPKGYFKFGGSTVILFLKKGQVKVDEDILKNTEDGLETRVNMGETIGKRLN
ncbi:phosphatidylserine decarboxylase [Serpentinicella sp. ANB-PHB4]|uniref:phosphatidylserine decarboxylase n=1 Tax=Serpentinicella sp. ANB-PHB4 TaxID=3074076 RepID=UPI00285B7F9A|nr:phosphatidylserine decarboxylase [Serpentinicella sp. ANB-PHB4]MDR5659327.1 phosphatidylserine decarboxylase [Serpentinicella sp. ANB-PHB4]